MRGMFLPPDNEQRLGYFNQFPNGVESQDSRFRARRRHEIRASNRNVAHLACNYFHLAMPHVAGQSSDAEKHEFSAEERMRGVRDNNLVFAFLIDERGLTLVEVCPYRAGRPTAGPSPRG
jgi:hypothetical protein